MTTDAVLLIAAREAEEAARNETTLDGRLKAAFKCMAKFWLSTDDSLCFKGALAGVMLLSDEADKEKLTQAASELRALNAIMSGVPVDLSLMKISDKPIPLLAMWHDAKTIR